MSGTYEDMMTPEQARMMYAALLDKLPLNSPAAQSIGAGAGLPLELLSAQPPTDQTAAAAATAPVVTEGTAAQLPVPPIPPSEAPSAAPSEAPPDQTDPLGRLRSLIGGGERPSQEDRGRESLMNFFFSMAASRNPSFFGQLGEAGQALAQADRAARTEARQERQLDVEAAYRAAAEARQLREQLAQEDPNSAQGRFMQARINNLEAQSNYYARRGAGEGAAARDRVVARERGADGRLYLIYESGAMRPAGGENAAVLMDPANSIVGRRYMDWEQRRSTTAQRLAENMVLPPAERDRRMADWLRTNPAPPNPFARYEAATQGQTAQPTAPTESGPPRIRTGMTD